MLWNENHRFICLLLVCSFFFVQVTAQTDYEFWFAAPEITFETVNPSPIIYQNLDRPIALIVTTAEGPAIITVDQPANPSFIPVVDTVMNDSAKIIDLTTYIDQIENKPSNTVLNYGLHITSDRLITIQYEIQSLENQATYSLLGRNALGYEFIIPSQNHHSNYEYCNPPARNQFSIVATEDTTHIQVVPAKDIDGHIALDTLTLMLNRGQTWTGRAVSSDSSEHLGGSFVFSDKPVSISVTDDMVFIPNLTADSYDVAGDQLIPRHICHNEYIPCGGSASLPLGNRLFVYAFEDSTIVQFNGVVVDTIQRGEYSELLIDYLVYVGYIVTNNNVLIYHFWGANLPTLSQQACDIIPPLNCSGSKRVSVTNSNPYLSLNAGPSLYIVVKPEDQNSFTISGSPSVPPPTVFYPIPGTNGEWVYGTFGFSGNAWPPTITRVITNSSGHFQLSTRLHHPFHFSKCAYYTDFSALSLGTDKHICPDDSLLLDAGFGRDSYIWNTGDTTQSIWIYSPGIFWVQTSEGSCSLSDTIEISYYSKQNPVWLGSDTVICAGDTIALNAGVGRTWYLWNTGDTTQQITVNQPGTYWVKVPDYYCSIYDTIQIQLTPTPIITNSPLSKSICSVESTNIPLTSNLTSTDFSWTAIGSSPLVTGYGPGTGDTIDQVLTNIGSNPETVTYTITPYIGNCIGDSVQYVVTITPGDSVNISISASIDSICDGTPVTFNATTINGGITPAFQWKVNGLNQGTNDSLFTYATDNGDSITCVLTSSNTSCTANNPAASNSISMTVYSNLPVSISISTMENPVCEGNEATYTASTGNKGSLPTFQWFVNGNLVGTNDSTYVYTSSDGDQVYCILTSSEQCTSNNPASSDTITMIVNPLLPVGISISASANPVCEGLPVIFTATPVNGGSMPVYQWRVNGINAGTNNPNLTYNPANGDLVTCTLTSNAECVTNNPATSNSISMSVGEAPNVSFEVCFDTITTLNAKPFKLKGGVPFGGTYSGPGVDQVTGYFNPAMAGLGSKTINYSYTNQYTCSDNATRNISVINPEHFSCGDSLTDIRDNKKYPTIQIGIQCWLAVNLNHGQQIGGSSAQRDNCLVEKYCYNDLPVNCTQYGALYQWDELMRYEDAEEIQGLCPPGWHVPSEADWNQLFAVYQGNAFAGSPLLYTGYSGFNLLLAGVEFFNQSNRFDDFAAIMWSSTSHGLYKAWSHGMNEYNYSVSYYPSYRANAFSVRCVRE